MNQNNALGASFDGKHSWRDFGLVIGNSDIVGIPRPKTLLVEIPGASKRLDLSEALTGQIEYEGRELNFVLGGIGPISSWQNRLSDFLLSIHGKRIKVILDTDPEYYYIGRASVESFSRERAIGQIKLKVDCDPYKYEIASSAEPWLWDGLNFESGLIRDYRDITVSKSKQMKIEGSHIPVVPSFVVSDLTPSFASARVYSTHAGNSWPLEVGTNRFADLKILPEGDTLIFYGNYTVTIDFRGGSL